MFHILGAVLTVIATCILIIISVLLFIQIMSFKVYIEPINGIRRSSVELHGKIALVTGGNTGTGLETARYLARRGAKVIIACRNAQKSEEAIADIIETTRNKDVVFKYLDLAKFSSVRKFAEDFKRSYDRLDILVHNASCVGLKNQLSEDGIDLVMQVNYFGPFLLTNLLLDKVISSKPSRIVIVSSFAHHLANLTIDNLDGLSVEHNMKKYSNSKLCNVLWTKALAKRLPPGVTVNALRPEKITSWVTRALFKVPKKGAQMAINLCVASELDGVSGKYFMDCKPGAVSPLVNNANFIEEVWRKSVLLTR